MEHRGNERNAIWNTQETVASRRFEIQLPKFDGPLQVGIAAAAQSSLLDSEKLPIWGKTYEEVFSNATGWAYLNSGTNSIVKELVTCGVAVAIMFGLVRRHQGEPDGDWFIASSAYNTGDLKPEVVKNILTRENLMKANTVIIATKVNWWLMNHHVRQTADTAQGYLQKVLVQKYGPNLPAGIVSAADRLGHYCSTRFILSKAEIPNILETEPLPTVGNEPFIILDDIKLMLKTPPAGTRKMAVCYDAARRLARHELRKYCPGLADFLSLPDDQKRVLSNPAAYHVNAVYLTGTRAEGFNNSHYDKHIGRLGTFIKVAAPHSTLAKSPHFKETSIQSAPDYSPVWRQRLQAFLRSRGTFQSVETVEEPSVQAADQLYQVFFPHPVLQAELQELPSSSNE